MFSAEYTCLYAVSLPSLAGYSGRQHARGYERGLQRSGRRSRTEDRQRFSGSASATILRASADAQRKKKPTCSQPLVRTHPENGTKALYFHPVKAENIVGMGPEESQALLGDLLERLIRDDFVYRHKWRKGDMLLWDNRAAMHKAHFDYDPEEYRLLYRVLVVGEVPA